MNKEIRKHIYPCAGSQVGVYLRKMHYAIVITTEEQHRVDAPKTDIKSFGLDETEKSIDWFDRFVKMLKE